METIAKAPLLVLVLIVLFFGAKCDFSQREDLSLKDIIGQWSEKEDPDKIQFAGSNHQFAIFEDHSFHLKLRSWTDAIDPAQACPASRTDYVKGTFQIDENELKFIGSYSDESFSTETPNCNGEETFTFESEVELREDALIMVDKWGSRVRLIRP